MCIIFALKRGLKNVQKGPWIYLTLTVVLNDEKSSKRGREPYLIQGTRYEISFNF